MTDDDVKALAERLDMIAMWWSTTSTPRLGDVHAIAATALRTFSTDLAAARAELARCGRENCFGHDTGPNVKRWVTQAALDRVTAQRDATQRKLDEAVEMLKRHRKLTKNTFPGGGTITAEIDAFLASIQASGAKDV